jgi:hypothetical protein
MWFLIVPTRELISGFKLKSFSLKSLSNFSLFLYLFLKKIKVEKVHSHRHTSCRNIAHQVSKCNFRDFWKVLPNIELE